MCWADCNCAQHVGYTLTEGFHTMHYWRKNYCKTFRSYVDKLQMENQEAFSVRCCWESNMHCFMHVFVITIYKYMNSCSTLLCYMNKCQALIFWCCSFNNNSLESDWRIRHWQYFLIFNLCIIKLQHVNISIKNGHYCLSHTHKEAI